MAVSKSARALFTGICALGAAWPACIVAQSSSPPASDALLQSFENPPASARPRVWWHWMNGNITHEGIRLDLEWMKRIGIGGFQNFDAALGTPQVVEKRLAYMTPEWNDAFRYAVDFAQEQGLEMAIATSAGWSETGGPWVQPEQAMKKLVWSETDVPGGRRYTSKLAQPPGISGPFQDAPRPPGFDGEAHAVPQLYRDISVLAFPTAAAAPARATIRAGTRVIDGAALSDTKLVTGVPIKVGTDANSCITFAYDKPMSLASLVVGLPISSDFFRSPLASPVLEASVDGTTFRKIADVPAGALIQHTISFAPVTARQFRVCFGPPPQPFTDLLDTMAPGVDMSQGLGLQPKAPDELQVLELRLLPAPRVHRAEEKAAFAFVPDYYGIATGNVAASAAVDPKQIIDLTSRMTADGTLDWTPPAGRWTVLRFGYSLTGTVNHPATVEATGLEVDKLERAHVKSYLDTYLEKYQQILGADRIGARGVRALLVDSIEVGPQNWTESLPAEFQKRRGYALDKWMPALAGIIVGSAADSDRFLYDFRRTIAELISDAHYQQIADSAHARGLVQYGEALEQGRPVLGDDMEMRRYADVPMAAMWTYSEKKGEPTPNRFADIRGAASVAHIYGQNLVAAESLTSAFAPWNFAPRDLKPMIDMEFVLGVNRPVIHTSVHQPLVNKAPGLTLAIFGQYFNRNESWAEQAGAWVSYLSRTSYLLQQGRFAADVLYFYGEEAPLTALYQDRAMRDAPTGHGFDFANVDVLLNRVKVESGALVTDTGMRYRLLYLGGSSSRMTLAVLKRIETLVNEGATVVGERPRESPSQADDPQSFQRTADAVWSAANVQKGRVISGIDVNTALERLGVARDFDYQKPQSDSDIMFLHRHLPEGELYFVTNRKPRSERVDASFRVAGRQPEIWRAETGRAEPAAYRIENGRTRVTLKFEPYESYFVVFRHPTTTTAVTLSESKRTPLLTLDADWALTFQAGRGGPAGARPATVGSWTDNPDAAIRYFSGMATYSRTLKVPAAWLRKKTSGLVLDLGDVRELAEVVVNGRSLGVLWHPPYRVDLRDALRAGDNTLELRVTNLWVNRLIGDAQPNAEKVTFTISPPYRADAPLRTSGLLGPVTLQRVDSAAAP